MSTYHHIVLFKIHDEVSDGDFHRAVETLQALGQGNPEILQWVITPSLDSRKGRIIIEDAVFATPEAFEQFRSSPAHAAARDMMRAIADWLVGDYSI